MSNVRKFFSGLLEKIEEPVTTYVVDYFRKTPAGEAIEKKATEEAIKDYLRNPFVWLILITIGYLVFKGLKKK